MLTWPRLETLGLDAVVTTRHGGVSTGRYRALNLGLHVGDDAGRVVENRRRAAATVSAGLDDVVLANQVHGTSAVVVSAEHRGRGARATADAVAEADVLVTRSPGTVLTTLVADCVPVLLFAPGPGVLALAHAGWRGTVGRVLDAALAAMAPLGAAAPGVVAALGPAVGGRDYEVGPDVADAVHAAFAHRTDDLLRPSPAGRWLLDLREANRRVLLDAGVAPDNVLTTTATTGAAGPFFSDRAARPCGRFGLLARIRP